MKFLLKVFSMRMMAIGMIIFLVSIGMATLVESTYDIATAKVLIYNSRWFEILLFYLAINLIVNIFVYKMYEKGKYAVFAFHLSFLIIIIGAGVTRYASFEGMMLIPENTSSNILYANEPHISYSILDNKGNTLVNENHKKYLSDVVKNQFHYTEKAAGKTIHIDYVNFQKNCVDSVVSGSDNLLEIVTAGNETNYLKNGDYLPLSSFMISYGEEPKDFIGVTIKEVNGKLMMISKIPLTYLPMTEMARFRQQGMAPDSAYKTVPTDTLVPALVANLYQANNEFFVIKNFRKNATVKKVPTGNKKRGEDVLTVKVSDGTSSKTVQLVGGIGKIPTQENFEMNGLLYQMTFGATMFKIPFSIYLKDFQLDTYPGSKIASSYASEVRIEDGSYKKDYRIYMNHILDYKGFRFFQSSYIPDDPRTPQNDEATQLSVNYDAAGTNITYLGYLLMALGFFFSIFSKKGRIRELLKKIDESSEKRRKAMMVILVLLSFNFTFGQQPQVEQIPMHSDQKLHYGKPDQKKAEEEKGELSQALGQVPHEMSTEEEHSHVDNKYFNIIPKEESKKLGTLLVQDFRGRVIPFQTMAQNLLVKFHGSATYNNWDAVQVILSMHMYPRYWEDVKIINVPAAVRKVLNLPKYISFKDAYDTETGKMKFLTQYNDAMMKKESERNEFEKKLIKFVERHQIINSFRDFNWAYMKVVPLPEDPNFRWESPFSEEVATKNPTWGLKFLLYVSTLDKAGKSKDAKDYKKADKYLQEYKDYQRKEGANIVPSEFHVKAEIFYNKLHFFTYTEILYFLLGSVLLIISFARIFKEPTIKSEKRFSNMSKPVIWLMFATFIGHGLVLGLRWYISGHAPWSDGYEALIFIAWTTTLAGFIFSKKSHVVLAATAIMAFFMIFVTELNLLDPEISPLEPVLKSYWLMIHVAVITSSYGFLGLGCMLGMLNLVMYNFRNKNNGLRITSNINEISSVSEITMQIGLYLLLCGTFLGGIWANESWGRYWGWDPKEVWALVSALTYSVLLHLRMVPSVSDKLTFNIGSMWAYGAIMFTFFGVNFYLVGLHSYAQGDALAEVPMWIFWSVFSLYAFTELTAVHYNLYQYKSGDLGIKHFFKKWWVSALVLALLTATKMFFLDRGVQMHTITIYFELLACITLTLIVMFVYSGFRIRKLQTTK